MLCFPGLEPSEADAPLPLKMAADHHSSLFEATATADGLGRRLYPIPDEVCRYGEFGEFERSRKESGQWVFWNDRADLVLAGRYHDVKPLHVELSPTYLCNFACPWCSCRTAREDWSDEDVFNHPNATESTVMRNPSLQSILEHLAAYGIGIQWVGGEPTMNPLLYPAALRADALGLKQCLFTNGSLLDLRRIETLFDAHLVFVRVSLDAATPSVHEIHHAYRAERNYAARVIENVRTLIRVRRERRSATMIGISLVVDERNLHDVVPTARFVRQCCEEFGPGAVDYVIIRPTYQFYKAQVQLGPDTRTRLQELVCTGAEVAELLREVGVKVVAPKDSFQDEGAFPASVASGACLSCGWFAEVTPSGDMVVCSDRYGNPEYFIGNLAANSIDDIWRGDQRLKVLQFAERTSCFSSRCPRNGRGFHLNRVFHAIELCRRQGRISEVRKWIEDLRMVLPRPEHSFFL
jgi:MoaA/NifB/PqqE/SkfB family radical SAM enzyme